jgi:hypothetical protein
VSDFAARPGKIVGAAGGRRQRFTLDERTCGERIDCGRARSRAAEQLIGAHVGSHQRQDRSRKRARRGLTRHGIGIRRRRLGRKCDRRGTRGEQPRDLALDIVGELARAGLSEIHAVIGAQLADLAFEVRALLQEATGFVNKAVPDIDIGDAGVAGRIAIKRIQEQVSAVALRPRTTGKPTHSTGTPLDLSTPIISSIFFL